MRFSFVGVGKCPLCGATGKVYFPHRHANQSGTTNPFNAPIICQGIATAEETADMSKRRLAEMDRREAEYWDQKARQWAARRTVHE